jgi:hypothetical protein
MFVRYVLMWIRVFVFFFFLFLTKLKANYELNYIIL